MQNSRPAAISGLLLASLIIAVSVSISAETFGSETDSSQPKLTDIQIYNVTDLEDSEKRTKGELLASGTSQTFRINTSTLDTYRFSFKMQNNGDQAWEIDEEDELYHQGLIDDWKIQEIYYNISGQDGFNQGGSFENQRIDWDTGSTDSLHPGQEMEAEYIVEIPPETTELQQEFLVNDTEYSSGSEDQHTLQITRMGVIKPVLNEPPNQTTLQKDRIFEVNSTVECHDGVCGDVALTPRHGQDEEEMEVISETTDSPFYTLTDRQQKCDDMFDGSECELTWEVNATGERESEHLLDVNASSLTYSEIDENSSDENTVTIDTFILMDLDWPVIEFGFLDPGEQDKPAYGNIYEPYQEIVIDEYSASVDELSIKGTDLVSELDPSYTIEITNMAYSLENDTATQKPIEQDYQTVETDIDAGSRLRTFYWLDAPLGIVVGNYTGQVSYRARTEVE